MNENPNAAAQLAAERAAGIQAKLASPAGQSDANAGAGPEAAGQAAQAAAEFKALFAKLEDNFDQFDVLDLEKMRELFVVPGVRELVGDIDPKIIELLDIDATGAKVPAAAPAEAGGAAPAAVVASERTVAEPGNVEESPFQDMNLEDFNDYLADAITDDESFESTFKDQEIHEFILKKYSYSIKTAWQYRGDLQRMQSSLVDLLSNAFDLRALAKYKNKNSEYQAAVVQNKEIAERIVQRMIDFTKETEEAEEPAVEVAPKPRLGLKELAKNIMSAPGRGFRRAIEGLKSYYRRSVDAAAGRPAAVEVEEEEQEVAFAPEQMKKFEDFLKLIRNTKKRSHVTKQLKRIREANKPSGAAEGAADVATAGNQDIFNKAVEAGDLIRDINSFDPDLDDEDFSLQNPDDIVRLLEILGELKVSIDPAQKDKKTVADFMPASEAEETEDAEETETVEEAEESTEKKVGFWERIQFWNNGKREADAFVAGADFTYIGSELQEQLSGLHPKDKIFKKRHSALVRVQGLLASVVAAEGYKSKTEGVKRDHKAINQLRKELASLGILANKDAAEKVKQDEAAEKKAIKALDSTQLSEVRKNWFKRQLEITGDILRNPAFLLGVASGATVDLVLHMMGADPGNKVWIKVGLVGLVGETGLSHYSRGKLSALAQKGGRIGTASRGLFWMQQLAVDIGGRSMSHFALGFSGGAIGMHLGHAAFDNFTPNGPTIEHSPAAADSSVEQPAVIAADPDTEPVVVDADVDDDKSEGGSLGNQMKPDAGIIEDDADAEPVVVEDGKKEVEPQAAAAQQPAAGETGAAAPVTGEKPVITQQMKDELAEGAQKWTKAINGWWNNLVASQQQNGENQAATAAPAVPAATTAEPQNPFFTEVNQQRAGVDITPNIHDGSSTLPAAEAAAAAPVVVSGERAQDAATATVVSAGPVVEQAPQAVEVVEFDSDNIWAEAAEITGGDLKRTDFLKDVGVMFDHAGAGNHEHKIGDAVIVIPDSVNTAVDLQKLHDLHPEAVGFTSSDDSLRRLDTFYQEALNTAPEQRNALQQDVMEHFTGGMSGADLAENPEAVEAMLKIAHGETVDGSKHIIGDAAGQPNKQTP